MRDSSCVRMSGESRVGMSHALSVIRCRLSFSTLWPVSFIHDGTQKQSCDTRQELKRFPESLVADHTPPLEIPVAGFPRRGKRVLVKAAAVARATARVRLDVVRADRTQGSSKLVSDVGSARIGAQATEIVPGSISDEQRKSIGRAVPEGVGGNLERERAAPRLELFLERHGINFTQMSRSVVSIPCSASLRHARSVSMSYKSRVRMSDASFVTHPDSSLLTHAHA